MKHLTIMVIGFLALTLVFSGLAANPISAVTTTAAATEIVGDLSSTASSKIAEFEDAGKVVELEFYKTIMQALNRIQTILKGATGDIDKVADTNIRKIASELNDTLKKVDTISKDRMEQLLEGANTLHQAVADLPFTTDRIAATSVWPTTLKQLRAGDIQVTVLGVGLVDCKSYQMRIGGRVFDPHSAIGNRLEFALPNSLFSHGSPTEKIVSGTLILNPQSWFSGKIEVPIGFKVLPNKIASFELTPSFSVTTRVDSENYSVGFVKLSGKDGRRKHSQKPSKEGWKIDTSSIDVKKLGGEKSSPMRIEGLPTELGFVIYSDMDKIKRIGGSKPAWATFKYSWREFKEVPNVADGKPIVGALTLENSAVSFRLDQDVKTISGTIKDYTGKNFIITPGRSAYGWVRVEHIKENNTLQISTDL